MNKKFLILLLAVVMIIPLSASAGWFWDKPAPTAAPAAESAPELNKVAPDEVAAKYKLWADSFAKRNVEAVIANQNNFWFTIPELNYLFASETKKQKNPVLTDFKLTANNDTFNIAANFRQIVPGRFSFMAKVVKENNKAHLSLSQIRLYGWPIPASWVSKPLNKAIDEYFAFLYADSRYNGFTFSATDGVLKLKPEFK
jgi:hypothetical protein